MFSHGKKSAACFFDLAGGVIVSILVDDPSGSSETTIGTMIIVVRTLELLT
ncbi:MAG: hypothetical protein KDK99_16530 [Verrucomicrobiales bacterium]|nr:hypothetical protein [Verrucomicrobiales bacterium]